MATTQIALPANPQDVQAFLASKPDIPRHIGGAAFNSFRSFNCPGCDGKKLAGNSFCKPCYTKLPEEFKTLLGVVVKRRYVAGFFACLTFLKGNTRIAPRKRARKQASPELRALVLAARQASVQWPNEPLVEALKPFTSIK